MSKKPFDSFKLPDGTWMSLWGGGDNHFSPWSCFWAEFEPTKVPKTWYTSAPLPPETSPKDFGRARLPKAWYRVFRVGKTPGDWQPMQRQTAVLKQIGLDKDPDVLSDPGGAQLGAAERLKRGRYVLQAKIRVEGQDVELGGVTFSVK